MSVRRIHSHGRSVWQARVAHEGRRRSAVRPTKTAARGAEAKLLQALEQAAIEAQRGDPPPATLRGLFQAYVEDLQARGKGPDTVARALVTAKAVGATMPTLLEQEGRDLTERDIFAFRQARGRAGSKPATVNRDLRTLRALLRRFEPTFRFPAGAFHQEDDTRVRWLRPEEEVLVFATMPSPLREIARLAALTLMRLSELRGLRRDMVHLAQGVVLLPRAKGGARSVILSAAACEILQQQLEGHESPWVFPGPEGRPYTRVHVSRVFRTAARAAGLPDFRFHDLRHHGATMALNAGFTAPIVMALGGWRSEAMMRRYAAVTDQTLRRAAEAVSGNGGWQPMANPPAMHGMLPPWEG